MAARGTTTGIKDVPGDLAARAGKSLLLSVFHGDLKTLISGSGSGSMSGEIYITNCLDIFFTTCDRLKKSVLCSLMFKVGHMVPWPGRQCQKPSPPPAL